MDREKLKAKYDVTDEELDEALSGPVDRSMWSYIAAGALLTVLAVGLMIAGEWMALVGAVLVVIGSAMMLIGCVGQGVFLGLTKAKANGLMTP